MLLPVANTLSPLGRTSGGNSLQQSLVCYWKHDETSGNRADSTGRGNTFVDNNTVTSTTGKVGNASRFTAAASEYLTLASNADVVLGNVSYTFAGWFRLASLSNVHRLVNKSNTGAREYECYVNTDNKFYWDVYNGVGTGVSVAANSFGALSASTWYFLVFGFNTSDSKAYISVNGGTVDKSSAFTPGTNTSVFSLGARGQLDAGQYFNGDADELGLWRRVLSATEIATLYNSGNGMTLF